VPGPARAPARGPSAPTRIVAPRPAPQYAVRPGGSALRVGLRVAGVFAELILDPFPDVAGHVMEAPGIGRLASFRRSRTRHNAIIALLGCVAAEVVLRRSAGAAGVFPLGLGGEAEGLAHPLAEYLREAAGLMLSRLLDGVLRLVLVRTRIGSRYGHELLLRDLVVSEDSFERWRLPRSAALVYAWSL
jgi:hypothetical protein